MGKSRSLPVCLMAGDKGIGALNFQNFIPCDIIICVCIAFFRFKSRRPRLGQNNIIDNKETECIRRNTICAVL
ncbi:MAG: hypothetical protein ACFWUL_07295 [Dialister sp.]|jgi:hypothetical protein